MSIADERQRIEDPSFRNTAPFSHLAFTNSWKFLTLHSTMICRAILSSENSYNSVHNVEGTTFAVLDPPLVQLREPPSEFAQQTRETHTVVPWFSN